MAGKGMTPKKGYDPKKYADNYNNINWKKKNESIFRDRDKPNKK